MPEISLYRKINYEYSDAAHANVHVHVPELTYVDAMGDEQFINFPDEVQDNININEYDNNWNPQFHSLRYHQEFTIGNPSAFFGPEEITDSENEIGIAVHIFSSTSKFQKTMVLPKTIIDTTDITNIDFDFEFEKSWMRGKINLEFFFFLKRSSITHPFQASEEGMRLSFDNLFETSLVVDGTGSTFPITEIENPGGPLWQMRKLWADPLVDPFDASSVQVELNSKHPKFGTLVKTTSTSTGIGAILMDQIMDQAVAMIIYEAIQDTAADGWRITEEEANEGSVAKVVQYWINLYEIDPISDSMMTIFNKVMTRTK